MNEEGWYDDYNRERIHVFDLPQIYQKPDAEALLGALDLLSETTSESVRARRKPNRIVDSAGLPRYLTTIISSPLDWIQDEDVKEQIWSAASLQLTERSGRNAMPSVTRSFQISDDLTIKLHEPSLTSDNLGFKTWASSLLMSQRLPSLRQLLSGDKLTVLELGAGTGLLGISVACLWKAEVILTDLPGIVGNLARNLEWNAAVIAAAGGVARARVLDWSDATKVPEAESSKFSVILAADPIYSPDHPRVLANTILKWLVMEEKSRVVIGLPLREHYAKERADIRKLLDDAGLSLVAEGTEDGHDDWVNRDGTPTEVHCWWGVWKPAR